MSEHQMPDGGGGIFWMASVVCAIISFAQVEAFVKIVAALGGIGSTVMAMRYYYYATKKAKSS